MYGAEQIRTKLGEDLETVTVAGGYSFTVATVDPDGMRDPGVLPTPALQILAVEGEADEASIRGGGTTPFLGLERMSYAVDLFARDGELASLERAAADVRNAIERAGSAVRVGAIPGFKTLRVLGWEFLEGPDAQRTLNHRIRFRLEVERLFNYGDA